MRKVFVAFLVLVSFKIDAQEMEFQTKVVKVESPYRLLRSPKKLGEQMMNSTLLVGFTRETPKFDFCIDRDKRGRPSSVPTCVFRGREIFLEKKMWKKYY